MKTLGKKSIMGKGEIMKLKSFEEIEALVFGKKTISELSEFENRVCIHLMGILDDYKSGVIDKGQATALKLKLRKRYDKGMTHYMFFQTAKRIVADLELEFDATEVFVSKMLDKCTVLGLVAKQENCDLYTKIQVAIFDYFEDKIKKEAE